MICPAPGCTKPVTPRAAGIGGRPRKYCSKQCGIDAGNKRRHAKIAAARAALPPRDCEYRNCEGTFEDTRSDRRFCDDICAASESGWTYFEEHGHWRKPGDQKLATNSARTKAATYARRVQREPDTCAHASCDSGPFCSLVLRDGDRFCSARCAANSAGNGWAARNPGYMRHMAARRRAKANDNGGWPLSFREFPIYREQQWWLAHGVEMDVDHWLPIKLGGAHAPWNLTLLLAVDNGQKSATHPADWTPPAYYTDLPVAA